MRISSQKKILQEFIRQRRNDFIVDDEPEMILPTVSIFPGRSASTSLTTYKKQTFDSTPRNGHHVKVITKNGEPDAFVWHTTPDNIKKGLRWGIIHAESITGKVIATLGQYRISAHEIIAKGMISNTHRQKIKLLDIYQDRFTALQPLESLMNQEPTDIDVNEIQLKIADYVKELRQLKATHFDCLGDATGKQIQADIDADIQRAEAYQQTLHQRQSVSEATSARGYYTLMEFIKSQMLTNLYEMQGINQDLTFRTDRTFALTRGKMNDYIEDARKAINDHQPDQYNLVGDKHHGMFRKNNHQIAYDFSADKLTPENERKAMLAVSFIEEWDNVTYRDGKPILHNEFGEVALKEIAATRWRTSRDWTSFFRKIGIMLLNMLKSFVVATKPWKEDEWEYTEGDKRFHLVANDIQNCSRLNKPLWHTPYHALKRFVVGFKDMFYGIYNTGKTLFKTPFDLVFDWYASKKLPSYNKVITAANNELHIIEEAEKSGLSVILNEVAARAKVDKKVFFRKQQYNERSHALIAFQDYHLTSGEPNDILNSLVHGLTEFSEYFTHEFAKNPFQGLVFYTTYGIAGLTVAAPHLVAGFGQSFLAFQHNLGYTLGGSPFAATLSVASIESQVMSLVTDGVMHGPTGTLGNIGYEFLKNPMRLATFAGIAYGTGYLLAEGVAGFRLFGDILSEEMQGSTLNYTVLGIKSLVLTDALFHKNKEYKFVQADIDINSDNLRKNNDKLALHKNLIRKYQFIKWLADHHKRIPKLPTEMRCNIERHIDKLFDTKEANALRKLVRHEKNRSIAYQSLAIPLGYIPAIFRIIVSLPVCLAAAICQHHSPMQPFYISLKELFKKTAKDMARVVIFLTELSRLIVNNFVSMIKVFTYCAEMTLARIGSLFGWNPGHSSHRFFAFMHRGLRQFGELLYPNFAAKQMATGNPTSTMNRYEQSYKKLLTQLDVQPGSVVIPLPEVPADGNQATQHIEPIETRPHETYQPVTSRHQ